MIPLLLALTFNFSGVDTVVVDSIEINHLHDGNGCFFLHQVVFWDVTTDGRRVCQGWKNLQNCRISGNTVYLSGKRIRFTSQSESWTDFDPELEARNDWPMYRRSVK